MQDGTIPLVRNLAAREHRQGIHTSIRKVKEDLGGASYNSRSYVVPTNTREEGEGDHASQRALIAICYKVWLSRVQSRLISLGTYKLAR